MACLPEVALHVSVQAHRVGMLMWRCWRLGCGSANLASLVSLKVLVEALVKPVQVLDASDAIQPALADLLSGPKEH